MNALAQVRVRCANCKQELEVNRHIANLPPEWPEGKVHWVPELEGFVGTVSCPGCGHYTTYLRP
jgi:ribosomal protein S27E